MSESTDVLEEVLTEIGLRSIINLFRKENVTDNMISSLSDQELVRLGVETIGDRIRFREGMKLRRRTEDNRPVQNVDRNLLFRPSNGGNRSKPSGTPTSKKKNDGWSGQFLCLSYVNEIKAPTAVNKEILAKAGLGLKKVRLLHVDSESEVCRKLCDDLGFPKLKGAGGFDLMRMQQNGRELKLIERPWTSKNLRSVVGAQARIYIRPIQQSLSLDPEPGTEGGEKNVEFECIGCKRLFPLDDLRIHVALCAANLFSENQGTDTSETPGLNETFALAEGDVINVSFNRAGIAADFLNTSVVNEVNISESIQNFSVPGNENFARETSGDITDANASISFLSDTIDSCIAFCITNSVTNPVEILKKLQEDVVTGRDLEVKDTADSLEGDTNYIIVDRWNILQTGMNELKGLGETELRKTLEVTFYEEMAQDYGGPRKEFFRLTLQEINTVYFDKGLRELLKEDYKTVGLIFALSILQNGPFPTFLSDEIIEQLWNGQDVSPCIIKLREGLDILGIHKVCMQLPCFRFLFQKSNVVLSVKKLTSLLKPTFSEEGSNKCRQEKAIYSLFIKYLREVGRCSRGNERTIHLEDILSFVTGSPEEPYLGFSVHPSITFVEASESYLPTANTCVNVLNLPRPATLEEAPAENDLFNLYDMAFVNSYYGMK